MAQGHGLRASFAPAVLAGGVGNGGHLHLSAWRDGRNLHAGGDGPVGMTAEAEGFLAGVLDQLPALAALLTPSPASYLRMQPSHWAGVYAAWGHENREAALRASPAWPATGTGPRTSRSSASTWPPTRTWP